MQKDLGQRTITMIGPNKRTKRKGDYLVCPFKYAVIACEVLES